MARGSRPTTTLASTEAMPSGVPWMTAADESSLEATVSLACSECARNEERRIRGFARPAACPSLWPPAARPMAAAVVGFF
jgi:hypothetical protein